MLSAPTLRLNRREASEYLVRTHGVRRAPTTLAKLACIGGGPCFVRFNKKPLYSAADLDAWVAVRTSEPLLNTSQVGAAGPRP
jgi:hypothetical protein